MGFFSAPKKVITKEEFKSAMSRISLDNPHRVFVMDHFLGDISESGLEKNMDADEFAAHMHTLRETRNVHHIPESKLDEIEKALTKELQD